MSFLREFYEYGKFVKSLNANFLVLIPKKAGPKDLRDFRPISLLGSLYKWLAKVLANRLKKVVGKVVSKVWTRIFHVRPTRSARLAFLLFCEKLIFGKKVGVAT